jgi:ribonuclease T1
MIPEALPKPAAPARCSVVRRLAACAALCLIAVLPVSVAVARSDAPATTVGAHALPTEARATLDRIGRGGPFPYERDGVVFNNRERALPARPRGYYHEYTVPTPGVKTRGARRIVCGGDPRTISECYYSDDHYQTFRRIRQ